MRPFLIAPALVLAGALHAQPHVWTVPGTRGTSVKGLCWERASGTILAAIDNEVVRIDPVRGEISPFGQVPWDVPKHDDTPGPELDGLALAPGGAVDFTTDGPEEGHRRVRRMWPDGRIKTLAGSLDGDGVFAGDAQDPEAVSFSPSDLSTGADGTVYVAGGEGGRVLRIEAGSASGHAGVRAIAGMGALVQLELSEGEFDLAIARSHQDALRALIHPESVAAMADGTLLVADRSDHRICLLTPHRRSDGSQGSALATLAGHGAGTFNGGHPDGRDTVLDCPRKLAVGDQGQFFVLDQERAWRFIPWRSPDGQKYWRSEPLTGALDDLGPARDGAPATRLSCTAVARMRHIAAVPGGGLLLTDGDAEGGGHGGIRCLGFAGDSALAERVLAHRRAEQAGDWARARAITDRLAQLRDSHPSRMHDLPFRALCRAGVLLPGLGPDVHRMIGSFLLDPRVAAFRLALAVEAIHGGSRFERERLLAARTFLLLPPPEMAPAEAAGEDQRPAGPSGSKRRRVAEGPSGP